MSMTRRGFLAGIAGFGLASCARERETLARLTPDLRFGEREVYACAVAAQPHLRQAGDAALLNRAVVTMASTPDHAFTIVIGSIGQTGALRELNLAKAALDKLDRIPYYCLPGPGDADPSSADPFANFRRVFGAGQWVAERNGWVLIGLNTCETQDENGALSEAQLEWLSGRLRRVRRGRPVALFSHHPLAPTPEYPAAANAAEVLERLAEHPLKYAVSARYRGNHETEHDGVRFLSTVPCSTTLGNSDGSADKGYLGISVEHGEYVAEPVLLRT